MLLSNVSDHVSSTFAYITEANIPAASNTRVQSQIGQIFADIRANYRAYILPFIIIFGVLGNFAILFVFFTHSGGVSRTTRIYYLLLATTDILSLLTYNLVQFLRFGMRKITNYGFYLNFDQGTSVFCSGYEYVFYLSEALSNYYYLMFSLERLFAIRNPILSKKFFTKSRSVISIVTLFGIHAIAYITVFWTYAVVNNSCKRLQTNEFLYSYLTGFILPNSHFIPTVINIVINIWIVKSIQDASRKRLEIAGGGGEGAVKKKEVAITITIAIVQIIHFLIYFPSGFLWLLRTIYNVTNWDIKYPESYDVVLDWSNLSLALTSLGHCSNFFIYITRMSGFRNRLLHPCIYQDYAFSSKFSTVSRIEPKPL